MNGSKSTCPILWISFWAVPFVLLWFWTFFTLFRLFLTHILTPFLDSRLHIMLFYRKLTLGKFLVRFEWLQKYLSNLVNLSLSSPICFALILEGIVQEVAMIFPTPSNIIKKHSAGTCQVLQSLKRVMVFCSQNCSDLLWERIVLVIEKNFWN